MEQSAMNTTPVLLITRDDALAAAVAASLPGVFTIAAPDRVTAGRYWDDAPAVIIGADVAREVADDPLSPRSGVYVVTTPDMPAWLAARVRHLAAGGNPGTSY
jgi:hypothetical protein